MHNENVFRTRIHEASVRKIKLPSFASYIFVSFIIC